MAGDWIKMRAGLQTHPKVVRMSSALHADRLRTVGGLHAVWCLFDEHSDDGRLDGYTPDAIDNLIGWQGFAGAMQSVQWLEVGDGFTCLPRFDEHNGKSAKRRAMEAERKRRERSELGSESVQASASDADNKRTREEKRREEKNVSTTDVVDAPRKRSSVPAKPADVDQQTWDDFLAMRNKMRAAVTQTAIDGIAREAAKAGVTLATALSVCCTNGWRGFKAEWLARQSGGGFGANKQELIERQNQAALDEWLGKGEVVDV